MTTAVEIAQKAAELIGGDRAEQHGDKAKTFSSIAALWNAYLGVRSSKDAPISAVDVGHMMALLKIARAQGGSLNPDDWVDAAGYMACAGEIATAETKR
jgi:hypothetical protein